jgi:hypothetical protein
MNGLLLEGNSRMDSSNMLMKVPLIFKEDFNTTLSSPGMAIVQAWSGEQGAGSGDFLF